VLASVVAVALAGKAAPEPEPANPLEDLLITPAKDVAGAVVDLAKDAAGLAMGLPRFAADVAVYLVSLLRQLPGFAKSLYTADTSAFDAVTSFTVTTASTIFVLYVGLVALNLLLATLCTVKDANKKYLDLPKKIAGKPVKNPVFDAIQDYILDPISDWKNPVFLEEIAGKPDLASAGKTIAGAMSGCMILGCTGDALALMTGGANKGNAEALAWTLATALGVKYAINK